MPNNLPEKEIEVHVGDSGRPFSLKLTHSNRRVVRNLTGHSGRILFWYRDAAPHAVKQALVDFTNGLLIHEALEGDEFPTGGQDVYAFAQGEIWLVDWYGNSTAKGWGFHRVATDIVKIRVLEVPT